jgi:diguanylate cyclase (GGDEF)-like protein
MTADPQSIAPAEAEQAAPIDPRSILSSLGEAVYSWDIESDRMTWSQNAAEVLGIADLGQISTCAAYSVLTDPVSPHSLQLAIFECQRQDRGTGVPYSVRYLINPTPGTRIWVEDKGRWFANDMGRPRLAHGILRVVQAEARLISGRQHDPATGALTRADFSNALGEALERVIAGKRQLAVLIFGVEGLANLNRTYGYSVGDEVVAAVARRLKAHTRKFDLLGRYSGNKIAALLAPTLGEHLEQTALRLAQMVRDTPVATSVGALSASVRVGAVLAPAEAQEVGEILHAAEEALSNAKSDPNTIYAAYSKDTTTIAQRQDNAARTDVVLTALNDRRIQLAYQPIVHARDRTIAKYEALVRMRNQEGQLVGAGDIVPISEKLGFAHMVDHRVMELAVNTLKERPDICLTFNAGVGTVLHPEWLTSFSTLIGAAPETANRLVVEITETALIEDINTATRVVEEIKRMGCKVAIDDFGAGHTSFRNMRALPIDILKIDGAFIKNLRTSPDDRFFVRTLLQLASHLRVETVAEWVQDEESAAMLCEWGVAFLQGDFISPPLNELPGRDSRAVA